MSEVETFIPTAQDIFEADDASALLVTVPEWKKGDKVASFWIRQLPADEAIAFQDAMKKVENEVQGMFLILIACAVDKEVGGKPIFTAEHLEALRKKNINVLDRLQRVALRHNGMMRGAAAVAEAKNDLGGAPTAALPSS